MSAREIRICQGPQQGAVFCLDEGSYTAGLADDCDLIFEGAAAEHAFMIEITGEGVFATPLGSGIALGGQPASGRTAWESGVILASGDLAFLQRAQGSREPWPDQAARDPEKTAPAVEAEKEAEAPAKTAGGDADAAAPDARDEKPKGGPARRIAAVLLGTACIAAALMLTVGLQGHGGAGADLQALRDALDEKGFGGLEVLQKDGALHVSGEVGDGADLAALTAALPALSTRVALDVAVRDDECVSAENALRGFGYSYSVRRGDQGSLIARGYVKDQKAEGELYSKLPKRLRDKLSFDSVYASRLKRDLASLPSDDALPKSAAAHFLDNRVAVSGAVGVDAQKGVERARKALEALYGFPLRLSREEDGSAENILTMSQARPAPEAAPAPEDAAAAAAAPAAPAQDGALSPEDIMGVSLEPIKFFTTRSGHRYFEGGVLPSGQTVTEISLDRITIKKGDKTSEILLRGH